MFPSTPLIPAFVALGLYSSGVQSQDPPVPTIPATSCPTPPVQCCATVTRADNPTTAEVLNDLGITPEYPWELFGLACFPIPGTLGPGGNATCGTNYVPLCCGQQNLTIVAIDVDCVYVDTQA